MRPRLSPYLSPKGASPIRLDRVRSLISPPLFFGLGAARPPATPPPPQPLFRHYLYQKKV